ncbi:ORF8 [Haloarcula hispanica pleomorphic virus 1]|uniref:ORF8 n=1 Tax=Haloarcula hispanica pleomorphic virus 1 TaxID=710112 RepID=D3JVC5_9VIRU|nr:unkown [Haloarcula hispanica pleomorphic virus 1]ADB79724.1 ORF8 [Haloarcula hispanica pleomorphic virus 1]
MSILRKLIPVGAGGTLVTHCASRVNIPFVLWWHGETGPRPVSRVDACSLLTTRSHKPNGQYNVTGTSRRAQETPYSRSQARSETGIPRAARMLARPHHERYSTTSFHNQPVAHRTPPGGPAGGLLSGVLWVGGSLGGYPSQARTKPVAQPNQSSERSLFVRSRTTITQHVEQRRPVIIFSEQTGSKIPLPRRRVIRIILRCSFFEIA